MRKLIIFLMLLVTVTVTQAQPNITKYLTEADSVLNFVSISNKFTIVVVDTGAVDTLALEKLSFDETNYFTVATFSSATGAYVAEMIGAGSLGVVQYIVKEAGQGSWRLRMTDTAPGSVAATRVKVLAIQ